MGEGPFFFSKAFDREAVGNLVVGSVEFKSSFSVFKMEAGLPMQGGTHRLEGLLGGGGFVFGGIELGGALPTERAVGGDIRGASDRKTSRY